MIRIYTYEKCGTCRNALKFLDSHGIKAEIIPIRTRPPSRAELKQMLAYVGGDRRRLFNRSGRDYQALNLKDKLPAMSDAGVIDLLSTNGNLVKRPFLLTKNSGTVGFNEEHWRELLRDA